MNYSEIPLTFAVAGAAMVGVAAIPEAPGEVGVAIVVGGPQYRAGSHRQFTLLARRLAAAGVPAFRFDYRGMGDAEGAMRSFEAVSDDIGKSVDAFLEACASAGRPLRRVVLWGLCDAASAILMYLAETDDERISGIALANPWARSEAGEAQTRLKHYYGQRLLQREFWAKLFTGKLNVISSLRGVLENAVKARRKPAEAAAPGDFRERMARGAARFSGETLLLLSGRDYTAKEFIDYARGDPFWAGWLASARVRRVDLPEADHTFSSAAWRSEVEEATLRWLRRDR
ncbi:MAG: hydrolase 1, exosortase A system-associated [Candidatus Accumulibacter sp.]|jgi:exosortase A-associated hydrolase 1|nr:hydrolase 1, exosortase A system-associated [Accumulibacter sp.]